MPKNDWPTQTITVGAATITVERKTWGSSVIASRVASKLPVPEDGAEEWYQRLFARMVAQTTAIDGMEDPFPNHTGVGSEAEWTAAYAAIQQMDGDLLDQWFAALEQVDEPPSGKATWPLRKLSPDDLKNGESAGGMSKTPSGAESTPTPTS